MSGSRLARIFRFDLAWHLRRPLFWIWLAVLALNAWGLSTGSLTISSGEAQVGGTEAWITSQFAVSQMVAITVFVFYIFFIAVAAGMAVIQEADEWEVGELLHATPLRPGEYVWGKAGALFAVFLVVLAAQMAFSVFFNHVLPHPAGAEIFGPFALANYAVPALVFGVPPILFLGGVSFLLGERTRKPILVYLFPIALVAATVFLWDWSPAWLDADLNRWLMLVDVSGFRWLNETWLQVDRGVEFYNTAAVEFDTDFLASRAVIAGLGLGAVAWSARSFATGLRGSGEADPEPGAVAKEDADEATSGPAAAGLGGLGGLEALSAGGGAPDLGRSTLRVASSELRELASSAGLYLFIPLILSQTLARTLISLGAFDTRNIVTSGVAAVGGFDTLALLVCLLLLFYTVETLEREEATGVSALTRSSPVPTASLFAGKVAAMSVVAVVVLAAAAVGAAIGMAIQGIAGFDPGPFAWVWGAGMLPTFLLWIAFLAAVHALTGSRYVTYGAGLGALALTLYHALTGGLGWAANWMLWDALVWTDMGFFPLNREPLLVNRLYVLSAAVLLFVLAVVWHRRRAPDTVALLDRLRPKRLAVGALSLAPLAAVPIGLGVWLWLGAQGGFQGSEAEEAAADYWKENLATFRDHPVPDVDRLELDLELEPERRRLQSRGEMTLVNRRDSVLERVPLTAGFHWEDVRWTADGDSVAPEDRSGLHVFRPEGGLAPGDSLRVGWSFHGRYPDGWTSGGGGASTFVLPAGVVLHTFGPMMAPIPGYVEGIGRTEERDYEPADRPEGWWRGRTEPLIGTGSPFTARVEVTGPAGWRYHSVGVLVADSTADGRRTMTWETDYPVRFLNVVAGDWEVVADTFAVGPAAAGGGTADTARTAVYHHPSHEYRIDQVRGALAAAREHYARWFAPFPWRELRISEFPNLSQYAQGFPTNITFSEGVGFLTKSAGDVDAAFMVTAHEAAHQWWGNLLTPGEGPGGNVLSEGMAHFSTALLLEEEKGPAARRAFMERIETSYGEGRRADAARPLVDVDGSRPGDGTLTYDKGGWVFWMLMERMGRDRMLRGLRSFVDRYRHGPDYPVLHDFLAHMERFAEDTAAYRETTDRWFRRVAVPEYRIRQADARRDGAGGWVTELAVENIGTAAPRVEVAVARGSRGVAGEATGEVPETGDAPAVAGGPDTASAPAGEGPDARRDGEGPDARRDGEASYRVSSDTVRIGAARIDTVTVRSDFRPERAVIDPDVRLLMLERDAARRTLETAGTGGGSQETDTTGGGEGR
mgnify:CR=1 FL=1